MPWPLRGKTPGDRGTTGDPSSSVAPTRAKKEKNKKSEPQTLVTPLSPEQCREWTERWGLCEPQVAELRPVVLALSLVLQRAPQANEVKELLGEVAHGAARVARVLRAVGLPLDAAHAKVAQCLEEARWREHPSDDALSVLLERLAEVARRHADGQVQPTRHKTGDPVPVGWIDAALRRGWARAHPAEPYPDALRPSSSPGSPFWELVCDCYAAAGYGNEPKRALQAFVWQYHEHGRELRDDVRVAVAKRQASPGTSREK